MKDDYWLGIALIFFFIFLKGFVTLSEIAILAFRKDIETHRQNPDRYQILGQFYDDPEKFLASLRIISMFSVVAASAGAGIYAVRYLSPALSFIIPGYSIRSVVSVLLVAIIVTLLLLVFGYLVPKTIAHSHAGKIAPRVAPLVDVIARVLSYAGQAAKLVSNVFLLPLRTHSSFSEPSISEDEIKLMIDDGTKTGALDQTEHSLIKSIFEFTDTTAKEVMIPRIDMIALDINASQEQIVRTVVEEGYSRMPTYKGDIDNVLGLVYAKDLITMLEHRELIILVDIIRPASFVPETKKISEIMREFQLNRVHMAIVVDEFGGTEGIITLEDILEEIVGEIQDEYDEEEWEFEIASDGSILVAATIDIEDFNKRLGTQLPDSIDYETVGGFLGDHTGRILELNESIKYDNIIFTVVKKSDRRLEQLKIERIPDV